MPATEQDPAYVAVVIAFLGFAIGFPTGLFAVQHLG